MNKNWLWIILAVMVGFFIYNIFSSLQGPAKYVQRSYIAIYTFSRSEETTMYNRVSFSYEKTDELKKSYDYFQGISLEEKTVNYSQMLEKLSEQADRKVELISYQSTATLVDGDMEIEEFSVVKGMVKNDGDVWITGFGTNQLQLQANSSLSFIFPEDAQILSSSPEPDEKTGNVFFWETPGQLTFPIVSYQ